MSLKFTKNVNIIYNQPEIDKIEKQIPNKHQNMKNNQKDSHKPTKKFALWSKPLAVLLSHSMRSSKEKKNKRIESESEKTTTTSQPAS